MLKSILEFFNVRSMFENDFFYIGATFEKWPGNVKTTLNIYFGSATCFNFGDKHPKDVSKFVNVEV